MPTYEYECRSCKKGFDIFQKMTEEPLRKCPACGKNTLKKKIGMGAGIIFKGTGFYCTDYKSKTGTGGGNGKPVTSTSSSPAKDSAGKNTESKTS